VNEPSVAAEFATPEALLHAILELNGTDAWLEAYTPYPLHEVEHALGFPRSRIPYWVFAAGLVGACFAYAFQWWMAAVDYPVDVGGLPASSGPAFVPITFETMVLFASLTAFVAVLVCARLPSLWHPVFEIEGFESASINRFWLTLRRREARLDVPVLKRRLEEVGALRVVVNS
jgi:hypothetical protein